MLLCVKIRAVALDFDLISRNIEKVKEKEKEMEMIIPDDDSTKVTPVADIKPDVSIVQSFASLLNIQLGDNENGSSKWQGQGRHKDAGEEDELSALQKIGGAQSSNAEQNPNKASTSIKAPPFMDIRGKYADKLRNKLESGHGSLSGVDRMKEERDHALKRGDAAGHLMARSIASSQPVMTPSSKWLADTGTGALLAYLTNRSMKINLIPVPNRQKDSKTGKDMESLTRQLPNVKFHSLIKDDDKDANDILVKLMSKLDGLPELGVLVVSDRDDYLSSARKQGMYTCRVRPKNARRGNCTTDYTVEKIAEVEQIVNEINGISFNSVLTR